MTQKVAGFVRDKETKAILNTNEQDYQNYLAMRRNVFEKKSLEEKINTLEERLDNMQNVIDQILKKVT